MITRLLTAARAALQRRRVERELDDELAFHVEMETAANVARGLSPADARRRALRDLGGVVQTKQDVREVRATVLDSLLQDVRYAARSLQRRGGAAATAAAMLGVGIGITAAMFAIADALILRPAPFASPDQLALVYMGTERGGRFAVAPAVLRAWRDSAAFTGVESAVAATALVDANGTLAARGLARVTPGLFDLLGGVRPVRGRLFDAADVRAGITDRVLLSEDLWRSANQADATIVGRSIRVDGEPLVVGGVLPADFRFPSWDTVIWRAVDVEAMAASTAAELPIAYARFASAVPRDDALRIATDAARAADGSTAQLRARVQPLAGLVLNDYYARAVPLLAGGVVLVFLVLCANVSSLLLARFSTRAREFGMRSALGAPRRRLIRQAFIESAILGAAGVAAGIVLTWMLVSLARTFLPDAFLLRTLNPLNVDARVLAVASIAGIVATAAAGLLPAWVGTRTDVGDGFRTERIGTETRGARAVMRTLLVGEIALACALVVGATLLVRSFVNLTNAERGVEAENVLTVSMSFTAPALPDAAARAAVARLIEGRVRALPGVEQIAWTYGLPPGGGAVSFGMWRPAGPGGVPVDLEVTRYWVGPAFFDLYGIPLLRGRHFDASDAPDAVVIGHRLAQVLWPGLDPIGRDFSFDKEQFHVVGLVREIHHPSLDAHLDRPEFYQRMQSVVAFSMLSLRCGNACPSAAVLRQQIQGAHPAVRVSDVESLEEAYFEQLARPRAAAALGSTFAVVALVAAAGGLFSVLGYAVARRKREFGVRAALGASPADLRREVLQDGFAMAASGVVVGSIGAWLLGRALASLQYGITIADPLTWTIVIITLASTTALASWRPARQAMAADPVMLLRDE